MTNKEKAEQILNRNFTTGIDLKDYKEVKEMLMEMAKWKEEQMIKKALNWLNVELSAGDLKNENKEELLELFENELRD